MRVGASQGALRRGRQHELLAVGGPATRAPQPGWCWARRPRRATSDSCAAAHEGRRAWLDGALWDGGLALLACRLFM